MNKSKQLQTRAQPSPRCELSGGQVIDKIASWGPQDALLRLRLRKHYLVSLGCKISGLDQPLSLRSCAEGLVMTLPWIPGVDLAAYAQSRADSAAMGLLPMSEIVAIGHKLAVLIAEIADLGVVHGAIKARHVVIDPSSGSVTLIDFGESQFMRSLSADPNPVKIDHNNDLFALGQLLFWLATRQHIHDGRANRMWTPTDYSLEAIRHLPLSFNRILIGLLNAGSRQGYKHARAVATDLAQYDEAVNSTSDDLGRPPDLLLPLARFGREPEIHGLVTAYSKAAEVGDLGFCTALHTLPVCTRVLVQVDGITGIGKTAVIKDACRTMALHGARVAWGKFNQFGNNRPLWALTQALDAIVARIIDEDPAQKMILVERIRDSLTDLAQVIIEVIPRLAQLLGPQPKPPILSGDANRVRFELLIRRFIAAIATKEQPLVLVLDDMHWADQVSLDLLRGMLRDDAIHNLLIIAVNRSEAMYDGHPLQTIIELIRSDNSDFRCVTVSSWSPADIMHLTQACGVQTGGEGSALVDSILATTQGNPLGVIQALRTVHDFDALSYDTNRSSWRVDSDRVHELLTDSKTIDLIGRQLSLLPDDCLKFLSAGALLGAKFDLESLVAALMRPAHVVLEVLWPAFARGLLVLVDDETATSSIVVGLAHDLVQQAVYQHIGEEHIAELHTLIGRAMVVSYSASNVLDDHLFEVTHHFNSGTASTVNDEERQMLIKLNVSAGRKARNSGAAAASLVHFSQAQSLLRESDWQADQQRYFEITRDTAEAAYLAANFALLDNLVDFLRLRTLAAINIARLQELKIQGLLARNNLAEALAVGQYALGLLDVMLLDMGNPSSWPAVPKLDDLLLDQYENQRIDTALRVLMWLTPCAYIASFEMYARVILTMINLAREHPSSSLTPISYTNYGLTLCGAGRNDEGFQAGKLALALSDQVREEPLRCKVWTLTFGFLHHWFQPVQQSLQPLLDTTNDCLMCGDQEYVGYASFLYCDKAWGLEKLDTLELVHTEHTRAVEQFGHEFSWRHCQVWLQFIQSLRGDASISLTLQGKVFDGETGLVELEQANNHFSLFTGHTLKAILAWHRGDWRDALSQCRIADQYAMTAVATLLSVDHLMFWSLCELHQFDDLDADARAQILAEVDKMLEKLSLWADFAHENVSHKLALVVAERTRALGDELMAWQLYEKALEQVNLSPFIHDKALIAERAGDFYSSLGHVQIARERLHQAYDLYMNWGAVAAAETLMQRYPWLVQNNVQPITSNATGRVGVSLQNRLGNVFLELNVDRIILFLDDLSDVLVADRLADNLPAIRYVSVDTSRKDELPQYLTQRARQDSEYIVLYHPFDHPDGQQEAYLTQRSPGAAAAMPIFLAGVCCGTVYIEASKRRLLSSEFVSDRLAWHTRGIVDEIRALQLTQQIQAGKCMDLQTGLPNRSKFISVINLELVRTRTHRIHPAIVAVVQIVDFEFMAMVNDVDHSHAIFREIAMRLKNEAIAGLVVMARIDRLSFGLLYSGLEESPVMLHCQRIQAALQQPYLDELGLRIRINIGLGCDDYLNQGAELLQHAESALLSSRKQGIGYIAKFDQHMEHISRRNDLLSRDLNWAIQHEHDGLRLVYQPIVDMRTRRLAGFEALLRWHRPIHGEQNIQDVIEMAERNGLIFDIGRWLIDTVIAQIKAWRIEYSAVQNIKINFNASPHELSEPNYACWVLDALAANGLDGSAIVVEITETALVLDQNIMRSNLEKLTKAGVTICIDDFGVGTAALNRLHDCLASRLKIDRSFISVTDCTE